jgi:hypothetical protein
MNIVLHIFEMILSGQILPIETHVIDCSYFLTKRIVFFYASKCLDPMEMNKWLLTELDVVILQNFGRKIARQHRDFKQPSRQRQNR